MIDCEQKDEVKGAGRDDESVQLSKQDGQAGNPPHPDLTVMEVQRRYISKNGSQLVDIWHRIPFLVKIRMCNASHSA